MQSGWPIDVIFPLTVDTINGLRSHISAGKDARAGDPDFYRVIALHKIDPDVDETRDGTIFLDDISEISPEVQAKLLGVLQEKKFERVGGAETLSVDLRIIAATNRNLTEEIAAGRFRSDLYYRLNVFPITMPPLRNRKEDIPLLVEHFVAMFARRSGKRIDQIPKPPMERLVDYHWPGNVRELCNVIERASITSPGPELLLSETLSQDSQVSHGRVDSPDDFLSLKEMEHRHILKALKTTSWCISGDGGAAKLLNINPFTLRNRMKKLDLKRS